MARKTSDIAMLLGSRGKARSRGGFGSSLVGFVDQLLGRKSSRRQSGSSQSVSMWVFVGGLLVAFLAGFLVGDKVAASGDGVDPLRMQGRSPGFVNQIDTRPLSQQAFIVSIYPGLSDDEAKMRASDLCNYLREKGMQMARPYLATGKQGPVWTAVVYYDGAAQAETTRDALSRLPDDVPDMMFRQLRNTEAQWPRAWQIR